MGANIYYEPTERKKHDVSAMAPQTFIKMMEKVFGRFPCELNAGCVPQLAAMATMHGDEKHNPYRDLINGIEKFGSIQVDADY